MFDRQSTEHSLTLNVGESVIENQPVVKLLHVDSVLAFNVHIDIYILRHTDRIIYLEK